MARLIRGTRLDTRSARARLPQRREPFWHVVTSGRALGYRRGKRGGHWIARLQADRQKVYCAIGPADDVLDADGVGVFDFTMAQERARSFFEAKARELAGAPRAAPITVQGAMTAYMIAYRAGLTKGGGRAPGATQAAIDAHILPGLGSVRVADLTIDRLRSWLTGLTAAPAGIEDSQDALRRRRATANRIATVLKAALNLAWGDGAVSGDPVWRRLAPFKRVDQRATKYLTPQKCRRLIRAAAPGFRELVTGALMTGCRYGELAALRARDFHAEAGTLQVLLSKAGESRHIALGAEGVRFFSRMVAKKAPADHVFLRADGAPWGKSQAFRPMGAACAAAGIVPAVNFHALRHSYASSLAIKNVPLPVVAAQLGHRDLRMTTRYQHLSNSYVAAQVRKHMPNLGVARTRKKINKHKNRVIL